MNTLLPPTRLPGFPLPILITSGEPAGIGPELCAMLAQAQGAQGQLGQLGPHAAYGPHPLVVLGDVHLLNARARQSGIQASFVALPNTSNPLVSVQAQGVQVNIQAGTQAGNQAGIQPNTLPVLHIPLAAPCTPGQCNPANAAYVLKLLDTACDLCLQTQAAGMVTAPVQKSAIVPHWPGFIGHTEYLAQRCNAPDVLMMLVGGGMRVALATTHLPLRAVADAITPPLLTRALNTLIHGLKTQFGCPQPRILVCGLNPHAGEGGVLGHEDASIIAPVVAAFQAQGHNVRGPLPADTLFQPKYLNHCDAVLAMYHDQGLPVLKHASFGSGVNISLGLPIVRTSVDHGTALDLAGTATMEVGSLLQAVQCAQQCAQNTAPAIANPTPPKGHA